MRKYLALTMFLCLSLQVKAEERMITTSDGIQLYVNIEGSGTPVLYLHGGPGSGSYWFEKFFGDFMEQHYTMIYLDQRGVGRSSGNYESNFSMDRMVQDFEEIRKELGYDSWLTLGHSFGGILQMGYYKRFPDSVKGMIMVNCTLNIKQSFCESWSPKAAEFSGTPEMPCPDNPAELRKVLDSHITNLRLQNAFWKMGYSEEENEKIMDATYNDISNWNGSFGSLALGIPDYWVNYKIDSKNVKVPVLYFYGTEDWMVGPDHYKGIDFPIEIKWKSKGGHMPFMENREDLEKAVLSYKQKFNL